jgi:hypothetical protein
MYVYVVGESINRKVYLDIEKFLIKAYIAFPPSNRPVNDVPFPCCRGDFFPANSAT